MSKFMFIYRGGKPKSAQVGIERQPRWNRWFQQIGEHVVDRGAAARSIGIAGGASAFTNGDGSPSVWSEACMKIQLSRKAAGCTTVSGSVTKRGSPLAR